MNKLQTSICFLLFLAFGMTSASAVDSTNEADPYVLTANGTDANAYTATAPHVLKVTGGAANFTLSGEISGPIRLVMEYNSGLSFNNTARLMLTNASNSFTGGIQLTSGTMRVTNMAVLAGNQIDFNGGVLMVADNVSTFAGNITLAAGSWGGLRTGVNTTFSGVISGGGDLVVVTENGSSTILSGANTYTGVTSVGTVQGGANTAGVLVLGANDTLPATTVLEIGTSQNPTYTYTNTTRAEVQLNGKTNTVAGLYGNATANVIGAGTLNINVPDGQSFEYKGKFTTSPSIGIGGAGTQIFSNTGAVTLGTLTLTSGTLNFTNAPEATVTLGGLAVDEGTMDLNGRAMTVPANKITGGENAGKVINSAETVSTVTLTYGADTPQDISFLTGDIHVIAAGSSGARLNLTRKAQTFTGGFTVKGGVVRSGDTGNWEGSLLGAVPEEYVADAIILDGGTFQNNDGNITIPATQGITVTENGGSVRIGHKDSYHADMNSVISGDGWFGVSTDFAGEVRLYAQNTYAGETRIGTKMNANATNTGAVISTEIDGALPQTTDVVFGNTGANLRLKGTTQSIGALISRANCDPTQTPGEAADMGVISTTESALLTIGNQNASGIYTGRIHNVSTDTTKTVTLTKVGTGTQVLGGTLENTRTDLVLQDGTVDLDKSADKYAVRDATVSSGTLKLTGIGTNQIGGSLTMEKSTGTRAVLDLNGKTETVSTLNLPTENMAEGETLPQIQMNGGSLTGTLPSPTGSELPVYASVINTSEDLSDFTLGVPSTSRWNVPMTGNIQFVKQGGGRLYSGLGKNYTGGTVIEGGIFYSDGGNTGSGALEFKNGATLMNGNSPTFSNDIVLTGDGNLRAGGGSNGTVLTFNGEISGDGKLTFNNGESNGGNFVFTSANTYSGGTEMLGSGANGAGYSITLKNSEALGTGPLTVNGASASPYGLVLDTASGSLDVANQIVVNTGKTLEISKTGDEEAALSGNVSGAGTLDVYSVRFNLDLDKLISEDSDVLWDFTGVGKFDGVTFNVITEDPEMYDGKTIKLAEEEAILEGIELAGVYFEEAGGDVWSFGLDARGNLWMSLKGESGGGGGETPEPATWALLLLGMLGLCMKYRRS